MPRGSATRATVLAAVLIALGALVLYAPVLTRETRPVASTATPVSRAAPAQVALGPGEEACTDQVALGPDAQVAELRADPGERRGPRLEVRTIADGRRSAPAAVPAGYRGDSTLEVAIDPPPRSVIGELCVANAGARDVDLIGTTDARTTTRSATKVDGRPVAPDLQLRFFEAEPQRLVSRLGEVFDRMATLKGALVAPWVLWLLAAVLFAGVPAATLWMIHGALREDEEDARG